MFLINAAFGPLTRVLLRKPPRSVAERQALDRVLEHRQ
jgi:hypothetical protein